MTSTPQNGLICIGISRWKRQAVQEMLRPDYVSVTFLSSPKKALAQAQKQGASLGVWASRNYAGLLEKAAVQGIGVVRIEDGFLRSVGLGAAFTRPCSLVADTRGIYYDPRTPSDLEHLLLENAFSAAVLEQAERLLMQLRALRVTKYNTGTQSQARVSPFDSYAVLVPGQVEDDASIRHGSPVVCTNLGLLQAARQRHPDAFIIFKPHPDVASGYRVGAVPDDAAHALANAVVTNRAITDLYDECQHVETMSSLAGFEALLRGLTVTTHGQPFYAGWGLTEDMLPHPRRGQPRSLSALIAATLLLYPRYTHPRTGKACSAEETLQALAEAAAVPPTQRQQVRHLYARFRHSVFGVFDRRRRR